MIVDLTTTNVLLGVMAAVSLLEAAAFIGLFVAAFLLYRRIGRVIESIEERHVAPAAARVNAILDDIKGVTSTVTEEADRVHWAIGRIANTLRRFRRKSDKDPSSAWPGAE
jgi:hypothetical protein